MSKGSSGDGKPCALTKAFNALREVVFLRHMLKALIPDVEEEAARWTSKAHNLLTGLRASMTPGIRRGHL